MSPSMDPRERILLAWTKLEEASYYDLLRVGPGAPRSELQQAFHRFALAYHPDRHVDEDDELREKARAIFQRGSEAYTVLRDPRASALYQQSLKQGRLRLSIDEMQQLSRPTPSAPPARPRNSAFPFVAAMRTGEGAEVAERFEHLLAEGRTQAAYQQLGLLELIEPDNPEVTRRMEALARALKRRG